MVLVPIDVGNIRVCPWQVQSAALTDGVEGVPLCLPTMLPSFYKTGRGLLFPAAPVHRSRRKAAIIVVGHENRSPWRNPFCWPHSAGCNRPQTDGFRTVVLSEGEFWCGQMLLFHYPQGVRLILVVVFTAGVYKRAVSRADWRNPVAMKSQPRSSARRIRAAHLMWYCKVRMDSGTTGHVLVYKNARWTQSPNSSRISHDEMVNPNLRAI